MPKFMKVSLATPLAFLLYFIAVAPPEARAQQTLLHDCFDACTGEYVECVHDDGLLEEYCHGELSKCVTICRIVYGGFDLQAAMKTAESEE
jgi:hypothetical protein